MKLEKLLLYGIGAYIAYNWLKSKGVIPSTATAAPTTPVQEPPPGMAPRPTQYQ